MKFPSIQASSLTTILALASTTTTAIPLQTRQIPTTIHPTSISQYTVSTGAINFSTPRGLVLKTGTSDSDVTTLATFDFPPTLRGLRCRFVFDLSGDASAVVTGSARADVFTSLAPATGSTTTWPSGNLRDQHVGRLVADVGGEARWEQPVEGEAPVFDCPWGTSLAGELVGVYDAVRIEWDGSVAGPRIEVVG